MSSRFLLFIYGLLIATITFTSGTISSYALDECENTPASNVAPSQDLIDLCSSSLKSNINILSANTASNIAYGWEFVQGDIDSFELAVPEVLTSQESKQRFENRFITGCDFDNSGTFEEIFCISEDGYLFSSNLITTVANDIGIADSFNDEGFTGLASDRVTGIMYASSNDLTGSSLYTIDLDRGTATRIGPVTNSPGLIAIAINNQGQMFGVDILLNSLIKINKNTGAGTIVGSLGFNANFGQGMDFDESDNTCYLFAFNNNTFQAELRTCNTRTGLTQFVGVLGATVPGGIRQVTGAGIAASAPDLSLLPITPGLSNTANNISAEGATSNGNVAFLWGNVPGSLTIGGNICNGIVIDINRPKILGIIKALPNQIAELAIFVPFFTEPQIQVLTQAVDIKSCVKTEVILNTLLGPLIEE